MVTVIFANNSFPVLQLGVKLAQNGGGAPQHGFKLGRHIEVTGIWSLCVLP